MALIIHSDHRNFRVSVITDGCQTLQELYLDIMRIGRNTFCLE